MTYRELFTMILKMEIPDISQEMADAVYVRWMERDDQTTLLNMEAISDIMDELSMESERITEEKMFSEQKASRLFIDMDGTLAVFTPVDTLETLYEQGYFLNLQPHENVVDGLKLFMQKNPDIEVYILSSVLDDSAFALKEKQAWLDRYLPEIDRSHRLFPPMGEEKASAIPEGLWERDILLDDYSKNLHAWEPPAVGIKLMNGINGTKGTWAGKKIQYDLTPEEFAADLEKNIKDAVSGRSLAMRKIENAGITYTVFDEVVRGNGKKDLLLLRDSDREAITAIGWDEEIGEWDYGHYFGSDYAGLKQAIDYFEENMINQTILRNDSALREKEMKTNLEMVKQNGYTLQYVKDQTPEICLAAVQEDGRALEYVKEQTPEICLAAVQQSGYALLYVKEQTPEICLAAVQQCGYALQYVKEQTPEICLAAVKQNGYALAYAKEQTPEICLAAVKQNGYALQYVKEQTPEICMAAVEENAAALQYAKERMPEIESQETIISKFEPFRYEICAYENYTEIPANERITMMDENGEVVFVSGAESILAENRYQNALRAMGFDNSEEEDVWGTSTLPIWNSPITEDRYFVESMESRMEDVEINENSFFQFDEGTLNALKMPIAVISTPADSHCYISELDEGSQRCIKDAVRIIEKREGLSGDKLTAAIEEVMTGRVSDLTEDIEIRTFIQQKEQQIDKDTSVQPKKAKDRGYSI